MRAELYLALHALFVFSLVFLRIQSVSGYLVSPVLPHKNSLKLFAELQPHLKEGRAFKTIKYLRTLIKVVAGYWRGTKPISAL